MRSIRIALTQINPVVGDIDFNINKILSFINIAKKKEADIIIFPEMCVVGYPPEDLILKPQFVNDNLKAINKLKNISDNILIIVGFVDKRMKNLYNSAAIIYNKKIIDIYHKIHLPNYGVFDEARYFTPGNDFSVYEINGFKFSVNICEDIWHLDVPKKQREKGANILINISASPYHKGKILEREKVLINVSKENCVFVFYVNMVGGQDELVFDGGSMVFNSSGDLIARAKQFCEDLIFFDFKLEEFQKFRKIKNDVKFIDKEIKNKSFSIFPVINEILQPIEEIYNALVLGTYDYVNKNNFQGVLIGLSGGIDSSLVATIAVDALGKERVYGVFMPSMYTSKESKEDVYLLVENLGILLYEIDITPIYFSYINQLNEIFKGKKEDITEENIQARIRGNLLMALSNKFGYLVLTTGNKSEMSVGYATLYGDMAGGFAVIKDVFKTLVYKLAEWRNSKSKVIPERILKKQPTAELKPGQKDTDTLPPYEILDEILQKYIVEEKSFEELIMNKNEKEIIKKVINMVDRSEYKRRQSPPGIKITERAFGKDRRYPITNRYKIYLKSQ